LQASLAAIIDLVGDNTHYGRMIKLLAPRLGEWVSRDEVIEALYVDKVGPLDAAGVVSATALMLRKRIAFYGLTIEGANRRGSARYRLLRTNVENETCRTAQLMP